MVASDLSQRRAFTAAVLHTGVLASYGVYGVHRMLQKIESRFHFSINPIVNRPEFFRCSYGMSEAP
jgi:hypothetical protein